MNAMVSRILMAIFIIVLGVLRYNGKSFTRRELSIIHRNKVTDENKLLYGKQSAKVMLIFGKNIYYRKHYIWTIQRNYSIYYINCWSNNIYRNVFKCTLQIYK